jgi:excisionase family DNA binding protein
VTPNAPTNCIPHDGPLLLTVPEVAERLGLGLTKTWQLVREGGDLNVVRIGKSVRVPYAELVAYIERLMGDQAQK